MSDSVAVGPTIIAKLRGGTVKLREALACLRVGQDEQAERLVEEFLVTLTALTEEKGASK